MGVLKDFDCSHVTKEQAIEGSDEHSIIRPGLAYVGRCRNPTCKVFGKQVVCNRGAGSHLVNDDITNDVLKCPVCCGRPQNSPAAASSSAAVSSASSSSASFSLDFIALYQCKAKVTVHAHEEQIQHVTATGSEIIKIGQPHSDNHNDAAALLATLRSGYLLTIDVSVRSVDGCSMM